MVKVATLFPAATVTLEGVDATEVELLESVTTVPVAGAGPASVTVPVEGVPPTTEVGLSARELTVGAVTLKLAERETPRVPVMFTEVLEATGLVVIVKVAVLAFAGTVTLVGTCATAALLDKVTTVPLAGAGPVNVTVPVEEVPPMTALGLRLTELRVAALTVNVAVLVLM